MRRKTTRSMVNARRVRSSKTDLCFSAGRVPGHSSRQPSISFKNSTSTGGRAALPLEAAYSSKAPDQTASREKHVPQLAQRSGILEAEVLNAAHGFALGRFVGSMVQS